MQFGIIKPPHVVEWEWQASCFVLDLALDLLKIKSTKDKFSVCKSYLFVPNIILDKDIMSKGFSLIDWSLSEAK